MTTQWNPAENQGGSGSDTDGTEEEHTSRRHEASQEPEEQRQEPERSEPDPGPWRVYTMPVPERPEYAAESNPSAEEAGYDGITGYPAPSGPAGATEAGERPPQRSTGRHARPSGAGSGRGPEPGEDDPDGLAGWVDSLTEAADDTRIAGRVTGAFPAVPAPERPRQGSEAEGVRDELPEAAGPAGPTWSATAQAGAHDPGAPGEQPEGPAETEPSSGPSEDAAATVPDESTGHAQTETTRGPDDPPPLPRRVPGASPVSGAFRALGPETAEDDTADDGAGTGTSAATDGNTDGSGTDEEGSEGSEGEAYRPTNQDTWRPARTSTRDELVERLDSLESLLEIGEGELPSSVTERSSQLLEHAGARLRLSGEHTVVALAGGTGSGKSSLFNALCGLELSQTGITRPTTSKAHACVWGNEGADDLLGWLGVPPRYRHSRTGVLDSGNSELHGLVLLDLPDHDSVRSMHTSEADRLIGSVDLLVWVVDPQKYADAALHHRYLANMAGHGAVTVAVLNQVDKVESEELEELLTDLRRLLETESGVHPRIITTSTITDHGVDDLRDFLSDTVRERRALVDRLDADLDVIVRDFEPFQGEGEIPTTVSTEVRSSLQKGLSNAAGVSAVADVTEANDVRRGRRRVGWPVVRRLTKLRKDPLAAVHLDFVRRDTENGVSGRVDAHGAELEKSLVEAADGVSEDMPPMWRRRMRAAARSRAEELTSELGGAVDGAVRGSERTPSWWGFARILQYVLLGVAGVGVAWAVVAALSWMGGGITGVRLFDDPIFIAYAGVVVAASLLVGWLTGVGCGNLVEVAAVQRREEIERTAEASVREIAGERVVRPLEAELERFRVFRRAYGVARGAGAD
ncbi:GTPase [Nocardiopsis xinjiangensis]|uniref:GTPase n=1 Tax=Nocardiopsis xinjiangensis TaxID=124285 RepID=UPI0003466542|nr:GTPase [Nocardiopsis xinjiangensis]